MGAWGNAPGFQAGSGQRYLNNARAWWWLD
jgi:hypothetical protein